MGDGLAQVVVRSGSTAGALAEVRRALGMPLQAKRIGADEFDELISSLYNAADAGAAALADDLAQDFDLSRLLQDIPRVEDLLESQNDAPLIRLINALFTQALRDGGDGATGHRPAPPNGFASQVPSQPLDTFPLRPLGRRGSG